MRGIIAGLVGLGLGLSACATPSANQGVATADLMTVSGRQGLPTAPPGSPFAGQIGVGDIVLAPEAVEPLRLDPTTLQPAVRQAFSRSLVNHGYLGSDEVDAVKLSVAIGSPTLSTDETSTTAGLDLTIRAPEGHAAAACLNHTASGRFRALAPLSSGGGERTTAVLATILMSLAGAPPGQFMADQFRNADAENAVLNSRRTVMEGEAVAPRGQPAARFAAMQALRVAIAAYVVHLGSDPACRPVPTPRITPARLDPDPLGEDLRQNRS